MTCTGSGAGGRAIGPSFEPIEVRGHCQGSQHSATMLEVAPNLCPVSPELATHLDSPIGGQERMEESIHEQGEALKAMRNRLRYMHTHDAFCLLRHAFALPKVLYTLRTLSSFQFPQPKTFELFLGGIANISIADDDLAWAQASLPVWSRVLGVRSATQLAPSTFLGLAAGCTNITRQLLPPRLRDTTYNACEDALKAWSVGHAEPPPPVEVAHCQKNWDVPLSKPPLKPSRALPQMPLPKPGYWLLVRKSLELGFMHYQLYRWACV